MKPTEPAPAHGDGGTAQPHDDFHNDRRRTRDQRRQRPGDPELGRGHRGRWRSCARSSSGGSSTCSSARRRRAIRSCRRWRCRRRTCRARRSVSPTFGNARSPQLMTDELADAADAARTEDKKLHGYGWIDEKAGVARVPIDQAKKLLVERGLPARAAGSAPARGHACPGAAASPAADGESPRTGNPPRSRRQVAPRRRRRRPRPPKRRRLLRQGTGAVTDRRHSEGTIVSFSSKTAAFMAATLLLAPRPCWRRGSRPTAVDPPSAKPGLLSKIGLDQRIGESLPLDLPFVDEIGPARSRSGDTSASGR